MARWDSEAVISDTLGRAPEMSRRFENLGLVVNRWRQFVGSYALPMLPDPMFVVQLAGKTDVRIGETHGWSERTSFPGAVSIVPAKRSTRWLVDGELDVLTFAFDRNRMGQLAPAILNDLRFAYADALGSALSSQILDELCREGSGQDNVYLEQLIGTLMMHIASGRTATARQLYPVSGSSSFRIHKVINMINSEPAADHNVRDLADQAGVTVSYFCRIFKQAVGLSPHDYVIKVRLDRAKQLLCDYQIPIGRVSELSGFAGSSQFTRCFHQKIGMSPSAFRNSARENHLPGA